MHVENEGTSQKHTTVKGNPESTQQERENHSQTSSQHTLQLTAEDSKGGAGPYPLFKLSVPKAAPITMPVKSFRLTFTVSSDIINHHVTPSADSVHGEILIFCTPGTTLYCKYIPVSCFFVQRFLFNVL